MVLGTRLSLGLGSNRVLNPDYAVPRGEYDANVTGLHLASSQFAWLDGYLAQTGSGVTGPPLGGREVEGLGRESTQGSSQKSTRLITEPRLSLRSSECSNR